MTDTHGMAIITGGGRGIGLGVAEVLAERGFGLSVWDIDDELAQDAAARLLSLGAAAEGRAVDVTNAAQVQAATSSVLQIHGRVDALVNCPVQVRRDRLEHMSLDDWEATLKVGLTGTFLCCQAVGQAMLSQRSGAIVNFASVSATHPQPLLGSYSACKAGVVGLTKQLAVEWGPRGVRCNTLSPGFVRTATSEAVYAVPELFERRRLMPPLERLGTPRDMGLAVAFLVSEDAAYISGIDLTVDGAFSCTLIDNIPSLAPDGSIVPPPISRTALMAG